MENNPFIYTKAFVPDNAEVEIDDFKRKPYAQQVSSIITSRREKKSIVVGIYGKWGEGKTTLLNFIKNELDKQKDIVCIQYNPWYYSDEAALIQNFFDNILEKLEKVSSSTDLIKQIKKYKKFLTQLSVSKSATVNLGVVQLDMDIGSSLSKSFVDLLKTKEIIQEMLGKQNIRIVFLMDDIDRLDKTEIQSIFKLVKLSADFDYIDYILAFDDKMVASALGEKYGSSNIESGRSFLEKIINVPLHLPQASETDLSKFLRKGMDKNVIPLIKSKVKEEDYDTFWRHFYFGMQIMLKTPRLAKLYQNSLIFSIPLLEDEVNLIDLMLIEGIRIFYPKMYNVIKSNAKLFVNQKAPIFQSELEGIIQTESEEIIQNIIETGFEGLYVQEQDSLKYLLIYLFPVTRKFLPNKTIHISEDQSLLERDKQIASPYYFYRYFCYTVPIGDISDIEMNDLT